MNYHNHFTGRPRFHFDEGAAGAGGAAGGGDAAAAAAAAAAASKPWHDGIDAEFIAHAQNKGWKLDSPKEAFAAAAKVARDLERHFGAPPDQILRMPKPDAKPDEIAAFRQRLGAPAKAEEYDFTPVKDKLPQPIADALRNSFYSNGITKDAAAALTADLVKAQDTIATTNTTVNSAKIAEEREALTKDWGGKDSNTYRFNLLAAKEGAARLGLDPEAVNALESLTGYKNVMNALRRIGNARKEDVFVEQPSGSGAVVTTREGAIARKAELFADPAWAKRLNAGDVEAKTEWKRLNAMIEGEAA